MKRARAPAEILDAMPPNAPEAEEALLGSIFFRLEVLDDVTGLVKADDFYTDANAMIFDCLNSIYAGGKTKVDVPIFMAVAKKQGIWRETDDREAPPGVTAGDLAGAIGASSTSVHAIYYAGIVRDMAIKRELRKAGEQIQRIGHDPQIDGSEGLDSSEQAILAIRDKRGNDKCQALSVGAILQEAMSSLEKRASGERKSGLDTGFPDLDKLIGFRDSELLILAARPSMGKTALALNLAASLTAKQRPVLFFSLEMSSDQVGERLLSSWAEVDAIKMRSGNLSPRDREAVVEAAATMSQAPLVIIDAVSLKMQDVFAACRRQKRKGGLSLVVIDYLQLIQADNPRDVREQQVARIAARLKGLAREMEVPVLCLAQLNRQVESSVNNRPRLSHLRESGAIEQDADVVAFVHRPEYFATEENDKAALKGKAEIYVEKNRNGRIGKVDLVWREDIVTFENAAPMNMGNYEPAFDRFNES